MTWHSFKACHNGSVKDMSRLAIDHYNPNDNETRESCWFDALDTINLKGLNSNGSITNNNHA